jgi:hypothetical protein
VDGDLGFPRSVPGSRGGRFVDPITHEEKRQIVAAFRKLRDAVHTKAADIENTFVAFQQTYRGGLRKSVDEFHTVTNQSRWVREFEIYLCEEIEPGFWRT